jgi:hypothetical protein
MINVTSNVAKNRIHASLIRSMFNIRNEAAGGIENILHRQYISVARAYQFGDMFTIRRAIDKRNNQLVKIFRRIYRRAALVFSRMAFDSFERQVKGAREDFWNGWRWWATAEAARQVQKVQNTTRKVIAEIIDKGFREGLSKAAIAKKIRSTGLISNKIRAFRIADTETHNGSVFAVDKSMESTGVKMIKEWKARFIRTRQWHAAASGQRRPQHLPFTVRGEQMMRPGDSSMGAGAANIVICHCVLFYHVVKRG